MKVLIDINLLIYVHNKDSVFNQSARKFIKRVLQEKKVFVAQQNLLELYAFFSKYISVKDALEVVRFYFLHPQITILYSTQKTEEILIKLLKKYAVTGVKIFDFHLIALAIEKNIPKIYTKNISDFKKIKEVEAEDPLKE